MEVAIERLQAKNGQPTLRARFPDGRSVFLHSAYNPEREAHEWAEGVVFGSNDILALFGCGAGYAATALRGRMGRRNHLLILDPLSDPPPCDLEPLRSALSDPRIRRTSNLSEFREAYERIDNACWKGISLLRLPAYERLFPEALKELAEWTARQINSLEIHRNTVFGSARLWQRNLFRNLVQLPTSGAVGAGFGAFKNRPVIIVSAGPSLNRNMQLLHEARDRALIIATGTAARLLSLEGIPYHIVISVDPNLVNWKAHFAGISHERAVLAYDLVTTPEVVAAHPGGKAAFYSLPDCRWLDEFCSPSPGLLRTGGSVANIAFDLAIKIGADPIILIGQDLAYTDGLGNAPGTYEDRWAHKIPPDWFEKSNEQVEELARGNPYCAYLLRKGRMSVPGIDGRPVWTDRVLFGFLHWFEETIERLRGKPRVIDATEGGALIRGTEVRDLAKTLQEDCSVEISREIAELCRRLSQPILQNRNKLCASLETTLNRMHGLQDSCARSVARFQEGHEGIPRDLEVEIVQGLEDVKRILHFALVPFLVRLQELPPAGSPEWSSMRRAFLQSLRETLEDCRTTMVETARRIQVGVQ